MSEKLINLQKELNEAIELQKEGILKGEIANELIEKLRRKDILDEFKNEIIKRKYEKLQNSIDTLWTSKGYHVGDNFSKWKNLIDLELGNPEGILSENEEQSIKLENTSKEQTIELSEGFKKLKETFEIEEERWLFTSGIAFFAIINVHIGFLIDFIYPELTLKFFFFIFIIIFSMVEISWIKSEKNQKKDPIKKNLIQIFVFLVYIFIFSYYIRILNLENNKHILNINNTYYTLLSISIIMFSFLYFSIFQYSKAKRLRIENQNKIAMIHGFQALRAESGDGILKTRFYNNIANVVFTPVYEDKNNQNLPIDKIIDLVNTIVKNTKN